MNGKELEQDLQFGPSIKYIDRQGWAIIGNGNCKPSPAGKPYQSEAKHIQDMQLGTESIKNQYHVKETIPIVTLV